MYIDTQETFSNGQSVVAAVGDVVSTNVYDSGTAHDEGIGEPLFLYAKTNIGITGGTVQVVLQDSADNVTFADKQASAVTAAANAPANTVLAQMRLPIGMRRYWRVVYRIGTAAVTVGTVSSFIALDVQASPQYATSYTVA